MTQKRATEALGNFEIQDGVTLPLQTSVTTKFTYMALQLWDLQIVSYIILAALKLFLCSLQMFASLREVEGREHKQLQSQHYPKAHISPSLPPLCSDWAHQHLD